MAENYYDRTVSINTDGTPLFAIDYDKSSEDELRKYLGDKWHCHIYPFGRLCPIDFYAIKDGRIVGLLELKTRHHQSGKYSTVFLNFRKWTALIMGKIGMGVPALFVVKFDDSVKYIEIGNVDATKIRMGGTNGIVKSHTDVEPVIEVDINLMKTC